MAQDDDTLWEMLAAYLVGSHTAKQEEIADTVQNGVIRQFGALDFNNLDGTQIAWLEATLPSVRWGFERSQQATSSFVQDYRRMRVQEVGVDESPLTPVITARQADRSGAVERTVAERFNEQKAATQLLVTGPARMKRAMPAPESDVKAKGLKGAVGAAIQIAMDGGRGVAEGEARRDPSMFALQRITDANPCYFCALLAANGPVATHTIYRDPKKWNVNRKKKVPFAPNAMFQATGEPANIAKAHDHCRCTVIPVYGGQFYVSDVAKEAAEIWNNTPNGKTPREALNNYRSAYNALHPKSAPLVDEPVDLDFLRAALLESGNANLRAWGRTLKSA